MGRIFQVTQANIEGFDADVNFQNADDQRDGEEDKADAKEHFTHQLKAKKEHRHTKHAAQKSRHPELLHLPDHMNPFPQTEDLLQVERVGFGLIVGVQFPNDIGERDKAIGVGQQKQ